jgi:uncharacterized RDD family membrane protein YckC
MQIQYPSLSQRILSTVIDQVLILVLMIGSAAVLDKFQSPDWTRPVMLLAIMGAYEPLAMIFGCTLGNYIIGIRARKVTDVTERVGVLQAYVRYVTKILLGWLSFLTINRNKERRAIHDLVAATVMIKV